MSERACFAQAAPIAVFTSVCSSGGGSTEGIPSDPIHSSRATVVTRVRIVFTNIEEDDCCHAKPGAEKY